MAHVSFILPAYKGRFLKESIESILNQTYRDFELVVVDDCSPEDLRGIVDSFRDERLSYRRNEENIGGKDLVAAWDRAMEYAKGEWCVLASDDDTYHPEYLAEMVALSGKYPEVDLVHCRNCEMDANGKLTLIGGPRAEFETGLQMVYSSSALRIHQRMADLFWRKSRYDELGGFPRYPRANYSDNMAAIMFAWKHGAACSGRILFNFRNSGENLSAHGAGREEKIASGLMFTADIAKLLAGAKPADGDDEKILELCLEGVRKQAERFIGIELRDMPIRDFARVYRSLPIAKERKKEFLKARIKNLIDPRRIFGRR